MRLKKLPVNTHKTAINFVLKRYKTAQSPDACIVLPYAPSTSVEWDWFIRYKTPQTLWFVKLDLT